METKSSRSRNGKDDKTRFMETERKRERLLNNAPLNNATPVPFPHPFRLMRTGTGTEWR